MKIQVITDQTYGRALTPEAEQMKQRQTENFTEKHDPCLHKWMIKLPRFSI